MPADALAQAGPPPVFVVGMPRSGTTLLARLLESCGPYVALPESHYFSRFIWVSIGRRSTASLIQSWSRFAAGRAWPLETVRAGMSDDAGMDRAADRYRAVFLDWVASELTRREHPPDTPWVENSPPHLEGVPFIRCLFPEARIIGMLRDPRAVHASLLEVDWNHANASANAERWNWYLNRFECWSRATPERLRLVRYEDLVTDPDRLLLDLSQWLGVPLLSTEENLAGKETGCFDPQHEPWKARVKQTPDPARIDRWRDCLTANAVAAIERRAGPAMVRHGYLPNTINAPLSYNGGIISTLLMRVRLKSFAAATWLRLAFWRCRRHSG